MSIDVTSRSANEIDYYPVMCKNVAKHAGFTLIELLMTIAIAGILITMAIPSFNSIISSNRLTNSANDLVGALNLARSEAIKRGQPVSIRKSGVNWESGWRLFTDRDGDGVEDVGDGDTLLRTYPALPATFTLRGTTPSYTNRITYQPSGISANGSFVICDNSDGNNVPEANTSRVIIINTVGRVRIGIDADNNGIPEKDDGEIISCTVSPFT